MTIELTPRPQPETPAPTPAPPKRPVSPEKRASNRTNSKCSTGPRSGGGKAVASRNAVKRTMICKAPITLPGEGPRGLKAEIDSWASQLGAVTDAERAQVVTAVVGHWRMNLARNAEAAATAIPPTAASGSWAIGRSSRPACGRTAASRGASAATPSGSPASARWTCSTARP
jgi:hypothetical protein